MNATILSIIFYNWKFKLTPHINDNLTVCNNSSMGWIDIKYNFVDHIKYSV